MAGPDPSETEALRRLIAALGRVHDAAAARLRTAMSASLVEIEAGYRTDLQPFRLTGRSMNSVHHTITGSGLTLVGSVGSSAVWARAFELGRLPGKYPPIEPLIGWVRRRGLAAGGRGRGGREIAVARAIQRKIYRKGIRAHPALQPAFRRSLPAIRARFAAVAAQVVADLARGSS